MVVTVVVVAIPAAVPIAMIVAVVVATIVTVAVVAVIVTVTVVAGNRVFPAADAHKVPASRDPIATRVVAGDPLIPRSRAWRNVGRRSADVYAPFGRFGGRSRQAQSTSNNCCTQHPLRHAFHEDLRPTRPALFNRFERRILSGSCGEAWLLLPSQVAGYVLIKHWFFRRLRKWREINGHNFLAGGVSN